jgi:hypothetical protein
MMPLAGGAGRYVILPTQLLSFRYQPIVMWYPPVSRLGKVIIQPPVGALVASWVAKIDVRRARVDVTGSRALGRDVREK